MRDDIFTEGFKRAAAMIGQPLRSAGIASAMGLAAAAVCAPQPAQAADITITTSGTVSSGKDLTRLFGVEVSTPLTGEKFKTVCFVNDQTGLQQIDYSGGIPYHSYIKNTSISDNPMTCTLTINDRSYTFGGNYPVASLASKVERQSLANSYAVQSFSVAENYYVGNSAGAASLYVNFVLPKTIVALGEIVPARWSPIWSAPASVTQSLPLGSNYNGTFNINRSVRDSAGRVLEKQGANGSLLVETLEVKFAASQEFQVQALNVSIIMDDLATSLGVASIVAQGPSPKELAKKLGLTAVEATIEKLTSSAEIPLAIKSYLELAVEELAFKNVFSRTLAGLSLVFKLGAVTARSLAFDPPDNNYAVVATPEPISFPQTGNPIVDKSAADYGQFVSLSLAMLHAAERKQGAELAGDKASQAMQAAAYQTYLQQLDDLKPVLDADNLQLKAALPPVDVNSFPGGAPTIVQLMQAQCGVPLDPDITALTSSLGFSQDRVAEEVCKYVNNLRPNDIKTNFGELLAKPLPY